MNNDAAIRLDWIFQKIKLNEDCMEWTGSFFRDRKRPKWMYPEISYKGKRWFGGRLVWTLLMGPIKNGHFICHTCDNNKCINPKHLYEGTCWQNTQDAYNRKRRSRIKLSREDIVFIKKNYKKYDKGESGSRFLAAKYNVSTSHIVDVANDLTWTKATPQPESPPKESENE